MGLLVLLFGLALLASLFGVVRGWRWAPPVVAAWLIVAVVAVWIAVRHPGAGRRCDLDIYNDHGGCAGATTIAVRDFLLFASPAIVAAVCLLLAVLRPQASASVAQRQYAAGDQQP